MLKRTLLALSLAATLILGLSGPHSVQSVVLTDIEIAALNQQDGPSVEYGEKQNNGGNRFVSALKAPFKAIGRLFGRGRKDDNKLRRLSKKDVKKFEQAPLTRVVDATSVPTLKPSDPGDSAESHLELGRSWLNGSNLNEAIAELSIAASKDPKLAEAYNLLGVAYHRKGMIELARDSFDASLKIDKNNAQTLNNLGYLLYSKGDYKGAQKRLKKAARLAPDDTRILNNLALAQSQLGNFDEAYKNFARAGGELEGRLNVANRLERAGRSGEALDHYKAARLLVETELKTNPNSPVITVVVQIKNGRIMYAAVENRRPGMEPYEASALRIVRQRRYPASKNGQEAIVVRVNPLPAS
ncbi:MAG TPA: tetratricopeptide repeat protein [Pyrinomonadaceae bacterium]|nr:tetratricopeptide repeat protein [Pyrinomonadaceae bacterium]